MRFLYTCTVMARVSPSMRIGYQIHGGETIVIAAPDAPTLIIKSPETFFRIFLEAPTPKAFFGKAEHIKPYLKDYVLFDGSPIPFNPVQHPAKRILEAYKALWDYGASVQVDMTFELALRALQETNGTFLQLPYLFISDTFRKRVIGQIKDPVVYHYWTYFDALPPRDQSSLASPILNRVMPLIADPDMRRIVAQKKSFKPPKTLIVDVENPFLSAMVMSTWKGLSFITTNIHVGESTPIMHIDYLEQLTPETRSKMMNAGYLISTRLGAHDAEKVEGHFDLKPDDYVLSALPDGQAYARLSTTETVFTYGIDLPLQLRNPHDISSRTEPIDRDIKRFFDGL